jgi:hypothetical protein
VRACPHPNVDDEANNSQIEMLGRMGSLAHDVRRFASQIHADFLTVRWDSGLVITWDAGQLKLTTTEVPGSLTLSQLELCLAAWKGDRPYDCARQGHIIAEGADRCLACGSETAQS